MQHCSTENAASRLDFSSILINNSAIFHPKVTQIAGHVAYTVLFLQFKFHVLSDLPYSAKLEAFMMGRGLRRNQFASEQNKRAMSCYWECRLPLFSQIIPRFGPNIDFSGAEI